MAYNPTDWKNREVERPRTFEMQNNPDGTITLVPSEGNVAEPGTPITAVNMNKIEQGIADSIPKTEKGQSNGIAQLGPDGKVPESQMPPPPDASTTVKGIVKLSNSVTSASNSEAATAGTVGFLNNLKANRLQSNRITATLFNGWLNAPNSPLYYYKDEFGVVHIQGAIYKTSGGTNLELFLTMPFGFHPLNSNDVLNSQGASIHLGTNGEMRFQENLASRSRVDISHSYRI